MSETPVHKGIQGSMTNTIHVPSCEDYVKCIVECLRLSYFQSVGVRHVFDEKPHLDNLCCCILWNILTLSPWLTAQGGPGPKSPQVTYHLSAVPSKVIGTAPDLECCGDEPVVW